MGIASSLVRSRGLQSPLALVLAITLCAALLGSCGKKDTIVGAGTPGTPKYGIPSSPLIVMTNLKTAYTAKDSVAYKACFDFRYFGESQDRTTQSPIDTLTFALEAQHISFLARSTTAIVDLQLVPIIVRSADLGDPPGWAMIENPVHRLSINDGANSYFVAPSQESMTFKFIPKTPDSTSPTDTTWKIIEWLEVAH